MLKKITMMLALLTSTASAEVVAWKDHHYYKNPMTDEVVDQTIYTIDLRSDKFVEGKYEEYLRFTCYSDGTIHVAMIDKTSKINDLQWSAESDEYVAEQQKMHPWFKGVRVAIRRDRGKIEYHPSSYLMSLDNLKDMAASNEVVIARYGILSDDDMSYPYEFHMNGFAEALKTFDPQCRSHP